MSASTVPSVSAPSDKAERLARAEWTVLAEATDSLAVLVLGRLGPLDALALLDEGPEALADALRAAGLADVAAGDVARGRERWLMRRKNLSPAETIDRFVSGGGRILVPGDSAWPEGLDDLGQLTPTCLWALGPGRIGDRAVALVGSRASTPYGEDMASAMAADLAADGTTVVSGGAYGIDAAAHRGALAGDGPTAAVLAGGLDHLYPRGNAALLAEIARHHLLLSEAPPFATPTRWRFLARNRLIAGLAGATVVVEAAYRSGALSTARRALDLMRPLGAVPGPVTSMASAGCHRLIREGGAVLVTGADDVRELLGPIGADPSHTVQDELDLVRDEDKPLWDAIPPRHPRSLEAVALTVGWTPEAVAAAVGRLELLGMVEVSERGVRRASGRG